MIGALLIGPTDPAWLPPDSHGLTRLLSNLGLIGASLEGPAALRWRVGERFLDHVCFLGCSPSLELEPTADGKPFCHVRLHLEQGPPRLVRGDLRRPPRCPTCRTPQPEPPIGPKTPAWTCPTCGAELGPADLDWGRSAGVARSFVIVANVFPYEAVPSAELMQALADDTGIDWRYFYAPVEE
jgi:hypothetical protein